MTTTERIKKAAKSATTKSNKKKATKKSPTQNQRSRYTTNILLLSFLSLGLLLLLLSSPTADTSYTDASGGFTVGYSSGMQRKDTDLGMVKFYSGNEDQPDSLILAGGDRTSGAGIYQMPGEERKTLLQSSADQAANSGTMLGELLGLTDVTAVGKVATFDKLPKIVITTSDVDEEGKVTEEVQEMPAEGIETTFTGKINDVSYKGNQYLYATETGGIRQYFVMAPEADWDNVSERLISLALYSK